MAMQEKADIKQLKGILRRRKKSFVLTFLLLFGGAALIASVLPPIYQSECTILIEGQQIPPEYVMTTITSFVEERLQVITQRIMSRAKLMEIINRFDLYRDMRDRYTTEEVIEKMREDIKFQTISAEVIDRRTGRPTAATIAFSLSYEGKQPGTVQKVANVLASLYLEENLKSREERASNTTEFLQQELTEIKEQIDTLQNKISDFKQAHITELPEYSAVNLQSISRLERDLDQVRMQMNAMKERKILLEGQIVNVDPLTPIVTEEGKTIMNPTERLKYLRLQLITLQSNLSDKHPDIKKLKKEIRELESQVGEVDDSVEKIKRLKDLGGQLAAMEGELGPKHPDVLKLSREVKALSSEMEHLGTEKAALDLGEEKPDNPAYISLKTQIASADMEIKSLTEREKEIRKEIRKYEEKMEKAPLVEKEYSNLLRDYDNARAKYNELMNKFMEARVAQGMEESQRGERFTIIDPAQLPEKPYKPNRLAILLIGLVLALGVGVGLAGFRETTDTSIKGIEDLFRSAGVPVLSAISFMQTPQERRARRVRWAFVALGCIAAVGVSLFVIDQFVMPLDVFWAKVQRRMMKMTVM
jgi:uncharacterized protein involved in exopolysaccharide biosynthesis